jgi:hypothetical protein
MWEVQPCPTTYRLVPQISTCLALSALPAPIPSSQHPAQIRSSDSTATARVPLNSLYISAALFHMPITNIQVTAFGSVNIFLFFPSVLATLTNSLLLHTELHLENIHPWTATKSCFLALVIRSAVKCSAFISLTSTVTSATFSPNGLRICAAIGSHNKPWVPEHY